MYANTDIWTLIGITDFAIPLLHVADLLLLLLSYCTKKGLIVTMVGKERQMNIILKLSNQIMNCIFEKILLILSYEDSEAFNLS